MTTGQGVTAILIHLVTPLAGVGAYGWLCWKMNREKVPEPPYLYFFLLFFNYGGCLLVLLTVFFWWISGMFILGGFYLGLIAPIVSWLLAAALRKQKHLTHYHLTAFRLALFYPMAVLAMAGCLFWGTALLSSR